MLYFCLKTCLSTALYKTVLRQVWDSWWNPFSISCLRQRFVLRIQVQVQVLINTITFTVFFWQFPRFNKILYTDKVLSLWEKYCSAIEPLILLHFFDTEEPISYLYSLCDVTYETLVTQLQLSHDVLRHYQVTGFAVSALSQHCQPQTRHHLLW